MAATQSKCVRSVVTKASRYRSVLLHQRVESTPPPDTQKHRCPCNVLLLLLCNVKVASLGLFAFTCAKNAAVVFAVRAAESLPVRHRNMVWSWTSTASSINAAFGPVRSRKHAVLSTSPPCCPVERWALTANEGRRATADSSGGVGVFKGVSVSISYIINTKVKVRRSEVLRELQVFVVSFKRHQRTTFPSMHLVIPNFGGRLKV